MIETFNNYANLINTVLLLGMMTFLWRLSQMTIANKDAQIALLKGQLEVSKKFEVREAVSRFESLKKYYESQKEEWYKITSERLNNEKEEAIKLKEANLQEELERQIKKLKKVKNSPPEFEELVFHNLSEDKILGDYRIIGYNPFDVERLINYEGTLRLTKNEKHINAVWSINKGKQKHEGIGLLKGNVLSILFWYTTPTYEVWHGLVSYEFVDKKIIRGTWIGKGTKDLGFEEGHRIKN